MTSCGILERQAVPESPETPTAPDEMQEIRLQLAEDSKKAGYDFLWDILHAPRHVAELRQALRALDIQPFSSASVEEYKRQARKRLNWKANVACFIGWSLVLLSVFLFVNLLLYGDALWLLGYQASVVTGMLVLFFSHSARWNWQLVLLCSYRRPIPEFVLETACRISDRMPRATFSVEELVRDRRVSDPFLVVQAGTPDTVQEIFYVEVFDEPRFERVE